MMTENKQVFKLGITGGIGSGKTSVCRVFEVLGIPVFSADHVASSLMASDSTIIRGVNSIAGKDLYSNGSLDKMELASMIFNNKVLLAKIDHLVHPAVFSNFRKWVMEQTAEYVIMEAAILFESGGSKLVNKTATIMAPVEERIIRVIERSQLSREQIVERMKNQMTDEERMQLSDYVIDNSENAMIIPSILKIHADILNTVKNQNR
jgi:dephospho-CoA kinase